MKTSLRVIGWNIRAGGGRRAEKIARQLIAWNADIAVLSEFRATPPSQEIAAHLAAAGLAYQKTTTHEVSAVSNALLIAARTPLRAVPLRSKPIEPGRWNMARLAAPKLAIGAMHIPNQHTGRKPGYHDAIANLARRWRGGPALLIGDTNSGKIGIDEERPVFNKRTDNWFEQLALAGWQDGFRTLHGAKREYTWYSANGGNGFRLDQIFVNQTLAPHLKRVCHLWPEDPERPGQRDGLSDHAALIADFDYGQIRLAKRGT